jgi:hypothetical protein
MTDPNVPAAVRLRAAECVFNCGIKGIEVEDIEARLANLEEATEANRGAEDSHGDVQRVDNGDRRRS